MEETNSIKTNYLREKGVQVPFAPRTTASLVQDQSRNQNLDTTLNKIFQELSTLDSKLSTLDSKLSTLDSKLSTLDNKLSTLENFMDSEFKSTAAILNVLNERITALESALSE